MRTTQQLSNLYEKISNITRLVSRGLVIIGCGYSTVMLLLNLFVPGRKMATIAGVYQKYYEDIWFNFIVSILLILLSGFFIKLFSMVIFTASYDLMHDEDNENTEDDDLNE